MASSQPARKRPRLADVEEDDLVNHVSLYHDDGNVILSCGSTLFRVHRSILSKHSPVFRGLFSPGEDRKPVILRNCVHVALDDTREEVEALLNVIYDGLRIDFPELTVENFPLLSNIFRMATKYRLDRTRTDILNRIRAEWPFELAMYDAKYDTLRRARLGGQQHVIQAAYAPNANQNAASLRQDDLAVPPASVISLLREGGCNDSQTLAPLFYALSCSTWHFGGPAIGHLISALTHADIERFIIGLEHIRSHTANLATACPTAVTLGLPEGHAISSCYTGIMHYWQESVTVLMQAQNAAMSRQPIEVWKEITAVGGRPARYMVCPQCSASLLAAMNRMRSEFWNKMPAFFGLV